jgi:4-hydroxy-3-methylbut-2-enyl diphosphate reductase
VTGVIAAPLHVEARAVRRGLTRGLTVVRTGAGARPAVIPQAEAVVVAGVCGALTTALHPGDVVVATEVRDDRGHTHPLPGAELLAGALRRAGLRTHVGPLHSADHVVHGPRRAALAATGAIAVDLETYALTVGSPVAQAVRVVVDTPDHPLLRPSTIVHGRRALHTLTELAPVLEDWLLSVRPRRAVLASPRSFCAGVERAIATVERALETASEPVYVRRQIVHNAHVVADLESRGAVFVQELDEVPDRATVVLSAHGVSPAVRAEAAGRDLVTIDATCPLVAKVHVEARRAAEAGRTVVLIGHAGHEEVEGTVGEAPDRTQVIASPGEVDSLAIDDPARVAYLTQTTLAIDETADVVDALKARFPAVSGPASSDICYATQNRQDAVRALAADCDLVLVVGSRNSSNSLRLVEVARRAGARAELVEDATQLSPALIATAARIGLSAGASAPETLVAGVVSALRGLGDVALSERTVAREEVHFKLPLEVRSTEVITCPSP